MTTILGPRLGIAAGLAIHGRAEGLPPNGRVRQDLSPDAVTATPYRHDDAWIDVTDRFRAA